MKRILLFALASGIMFLPVSAKDRTVHDPDYTNTETILHAWSWNFPTIAANMKNIADAGFTMVQTSPVQHCFNPEGGSKKLFDEKEGYWYYYYQPTDWKIGNQILGTREEMKQMMDSAARYGVKVIVDVLPNHTAFDVDAVSDEMIAAVGGRDKLYHSAGLVPVGDYGDRAQCTLQAMGNLPDVNTAKHIGVPYDPVDAASGVKVNDFWDVATGRKSVKGVRLALPYDSLFVYGEVL